MQALGSRARLVDEVPAGADAVLFLGGLRRFHDIQEAAGVHREAFIAAKAFCAGLPANGGSFVTVQDTGGCFGLSDKKVGTAAWAAGLTGLIKTAYREWPTTGVKAIDIETGDRPAREIAAALLEELRFGGPALEVGLAADGGRTVPELRSAKHRADGKPSAGLEPGSVVVVSGGARGVTAGALIEWSREKQLRLVLLGRTAQEEEPAQVRGMQVDAAIKQALLKIAVSEGRKVTPKELQSAARKILSGREIAATLAALRANGSQAEYAAVDVSDASSVSSALDAVRKKWGPIRGLVHGAGTLEDKLIADKTPQMFDFVFGTKVDGLRALLEATRKDPLGAIILFSSVAGRYGNVGQSDYAMANEVLNKVAQEEAKRRGDACLVRALDWGPWDGGMVTPALRGHFQKLGVALISLDGGARFMAQELREACRGDVEVVVGGSETEPDMSSRAGQTEQTYDILLDPAKYRMLESHQIRGQVVVPFVLAVDWFQRAAGAGPLKNIQLLKGIKLEDFGGTVRRLVLVVRGKLLELKGEDGTPHYRAELGPVAPLTAFEGDVLADASLTAPRVEAGKRIAAPSADIASGTARAENDLLAAPAGLRSSGIKDIYKGNLLFHGPAFRVISSELKVSQEAVSAGLSLPSPADWKDAGMVTPAAYLDGGLQLGILLGAHTIGKRVLPSRAGEFILYTKEIPDSVDCSVRMTKQRPEGLVYDVLLTASDGSPVAAVLSVEATAVPNEPPVTLLSSGKVGTK